MYVMNVRILVFSWSIWAAAPLRSYTSKQKSKPKTELWNAKVPISIKSMEFGGIFFKMANQFKSSLSRYCS